VEGDGGDQPEDDSESELDEQSDFDGSTEAASNESTGTCDF
jgi:hypothetical protein